jgi:hypothetical protein
MLLFVAFMWLVYLPDNKVIGGKILSNTEAITKYKQLSQSYDNPDLFTMYGRTFYILDEKVTIREEQIIMTPIGQILKKYEPNSTQFEDNMSTKLEVGTQIYQIKGESHILTVKIADKFRFYVKVE